MELGLSTPQLVISVQAFLQESPNEGQAQFQPAPHSEEHIPHASARSSHTGTTSALQHNLGVFSQVKA